MKFRLFPLLAALFFCSCTVQPTESQPPATLSAAESVQTESVWVPYDGNSNGYVYYNSSPRDADWEEDILFFGDSYLEEYPLLTHFPSRIEQGVDVTYSDAFYDPALRQTFLDRINQLIQNVSNLSDNEILYELQRTVALLEDAHTSVSIPWEEIYPIGFQEFQEDDQTVFYVTLVPEKYEYALGCTLTGINGIPLEEVIQRLRPYISTENEYWMRYQLSGGSSIGELANTALLEVAGIVQGGKAAYNLLTASGLAFDLKLERTQSEEIDGSDLVGITHYQVYPQIYGGSDMPNYFYRWEEDADMLYVRVNEFVSMESYSFYDLGNDVIRELRDAGGAKKLVIDLRRNPGGYQFYGYAEFITALARMDYEALYVLIDEGTFSGGILMAARIKAQFPDAILVGTPAGQPPNFFASMNDTDYVMPNCDILCRMPTAFHQDLPDYPYDALMPDLTVYPTWDDYSNCIDTILEAVKAQ